MQKAKPTEYMVPESAWEVEGQRGLTFRLTADKDGYYTYESVAAMSEVVEYDGRLYRRTGWNSDTGEVHYKTVAREQLAKPSSPDPNEGTGSLYGYDYFADEMNRMH